MLPWRTRPRRPRCAGTVRRWRGAPGTPASRSWPPVPSACSHNWPTGRASRGRWWSRAGTAASGTWWPASTATRTCVSSPPSSAGAGRGPGVCAEQRLGPQALGRRRPALRRPAPLRTRARRPGPHRAARPRRPAVRLGGHGAPGRRGVRAERLRRGHHRRGRRRTAHRGRQCLPGVRGQTGAPEALAALALRATRAPVT